MSLCSYDKCRWYGEAKPGGRKCYHGDPQCWKGWLEMFIVLFKIKFGRYNR